MFINSFEFFFASMNGMIEFPIVILVAQDGKAEEDGVDGVEDGG